MKKISLLAMLLVCLILLCGCGGKGGKMTEKEVADEKLSDRMFMKVSGEHCGQVIVDKETNVMYWMSYGSYNYGTLTLLVNPDGTPRIWEG